MSDDASEQMLALLGELSVLKELNAEFEKSQDESENEAYQQRLQREREIKQEITSLRDRKMASDRALG